MGAALEDSFTFTLEERRGSGIRMPFLIRGTGDQGKILLAEL